MTRLRRWWLPIAVFVAGAALASGLAVVSGIVPIKASSGHWAITAWLLDFSKRRSVATHTIGLDTPTFEEPWQVRKGAAHYESGCRPCHGSPDMPRPRIVQHMTPPPTYLPPRITRWSPPELFYIVKHGIKFTGMPAWPAAGRDDEAWAMVGFLRVLPAIGAEDYRRLVSGGVTPAEEATPLAGLPAPESAPRFVRDACARCHGIDRRARGAEAFPRLTGQSPLYLELALRAYASGARHSGIMSPIAAGLSEEAIRDAARYYGTPGSEGLGPVLPASADRGAAIATRGIPQQRVPACRDCHGPTSAARNPAYPVLSGQHPEYLALQLQLFAEDRRGGSAYAHIMRQVATGLTRAQMRDVALYYAALPGLAAP